MLRGCLVLALALQFATAGWAQETLHTLAFMEGRYTGGVSVEPTRDQPYPPVIRRLPATVSVERTADGLIIRWLTANEGYSTAVVGAIGPTIYRPPEAFENIDWECRPGSIPPFRPDRNAIIVTLLCFIPGQLQEPPTARIEIGSLLDRDTRRPTGRLLFDIRHLSERESGRVMRHYRGVLQRRLD